MQLKEHFMDRKFQIIFHFHRGEHHIVTLVRQVIGCSSDATLQIHDLVVDITDVDFLICPFFIVKSLKIHGRTTVSKDILHHKSCKVPTLLKAQLFRMVLVTDVLHERRNIVHRAVFFPQRILHDKKQQCKQHIHLLIPRLYAVILPLLLSKAVAAEQRIPPDKFHSLLKIL